VRAKKRCQRFKSTRLEEQKLLLNDLNYTRTVRTWVKKDGQLTPVDKQQRVLPWWRVNAHGSYAFFVLRWFEELLRVLSLILWHALLARFT